MLSGAFTITLADDPRAMVTSRLLSRAISRDWAEFATILVFALVGGFVLNDALRSAGLVSQLLSAVRYGGAGMRSTDGFPRLRCWHSALFLLLAGL
jgi:hypothetical protein